MISFWRMTPKDEFDWPSIKMAVRKAFRIYLVVFLPLMFVAEILFRPQIDFWGSLLWILLGAAAMSLLNGMRVAADQIEKALNRRIQRIREEAWQKKWTDTD